MNGRVSLLGLRAIAAIHSGRVVVQHGPTLPGPPMPYLPPDCPYAYELRGDGAWRVFHVGRDAKVSAEGVARWVRDVQSMACHRAHILGLKRNDVEP